MELYTIDELQRMLGSVGDNVQIDRSVRFVSPKNIFVGSNVRIDAWCFISGAGGVQIGNNVHIAHAAHLLGNGARIEIEDFSGISSRVSIFTSTDDYSEGWLTNPTVPTQFRKVKSAPVLFQKHVIVGCGSVVMPGCVLKIGASVGALSFVNKSVPEYSIVSGNPIRLLGRRDQQRLQTLEKEYRNI
jgi:galactoside O-acetyltransferase